MSNISEKIELNRLSNFLRSSIIWTLGAIVTVFTSILSLEGTLTSNIDGIAAKSIKSASNLIPVIGKALSESVDTVLGATSILKNSIGFIGLIIIIGICIIPIIKLLIIMVSYYLLSAICEPISDKKIVNLLSQMGGTFKVLLGTVTFISVLIIVGLTMCIRISNYGIMYR